MARTSHYLIMLHTFKPQERSQSFTYGKPVNKTRSMVPSKSESPLLSIPQPHFSPSSHALLLQLPLLSCPCTTPSSTAPFHTFTPIYPRDMTICPHLTWLIQSWSIYLLLLWWRLRFLGAADNSSGLSFTFTCLHKAKALPSLLAMPFLTPTRKWSALD